jgi:hypothetical protein
MGKFQSKFGETKPKKYVALFDYEKKARDELNMRKNDHILVCDFM